MHVVRELKVSERRACKAIGQCRSTQRTEAVVTPLDKKLTDIESSTSRRNLVGMGTVVRPRFSGRKVGT